jgi:hypothetical protein
MYEGTETCMHSFGEVTWRKKTDCKTKIWSTCGNHDEYGYNTSLKIGENRVGWINMAQGSNVLKDTVNTVMNVMLPLSVSNFLYS